MGEKIYVVGSGPSGISCAYALVNKGLDVTLLDGGVELEEWRLNIIKKLQNTNSEEWDNDSINTIKGKATSTVSGVSEKLSYGSNFPSQDVNKFIPFEIKSAETRLTLAKGGLSNVWGAAVLPYSQNDIDEWPITINDLEPHYKAVLSFMDISAELDDLSTLFPLYTEKYNPLRSSNQAKELMEDLNKNKLELNKRGITFGKSRVAARSFSINDKPGCVYCGLCLYGCPHELIYNSSFTLKQLQVKNNFKYIKNIVVKKVEEVNNKVKIYFISRLNGNEDYIEASRVYLACGPFSTTKILLESLEAFDTPLIMKDSQWFLLPYIRYKKTTNVLNEKLYTLPQVFIEVLDPKISKYTINLQVYSYTDHYIEAFKNSFLGGLYPILKFPVTEIMERLLVIMGFIHSNHSSTITVTLKKENNNKLILQGNINNISKKIINGIVKKLLENKHYLKAFPVQGISKLKQPGSGYHSGGSFPMRMHPREFEADILGRPYGFKKVHTVDSTIFPTIPATSITLTIMANAHRIASAYHET